MNPKLLPFDAQPVRQGGQPALLIKEKLGLSDQGVVVPQAIAPLLSLCDGTRDPATLRTGFLLRTGIGLPQSTIDQLLAELDEALLLEGPLFQAAYAAALEAFRAAPFRSMALADKSYPSNAEELRRALGGFWPASGPDPTEAQTLRGLVCPHIDFARGGPTYGQVWSRAAGAARSAELVVILGTDHLSDQPGFTLTRQSYATPLGTLPTSQEVVDAVAEAIGSENAFGHELHHRAEHSIELAAAWLHYVVDGQPVPLLPVLCGSFGPYMGGAGSPESDETLRQALAALSTATAGRRTLVVAAADLSHVGPAFGDPYPFGLGERATLASWDHELLERIRQGDAQGFFDSVRASGDRRRVCGLPPIYCTLRVLGECQGEVLGYAQCPADGTGGSLVSIAGALFR